MFADLTNPEEMGTSHADEALAVTAAAEGGEDSGEFLNV
jgi:histone demethylase JARID1